MIRYQQMTRLCLLLLLIISLGAQVPTKINLAYQARGGSESIQRSLGASMALGGTALTAGMGVVTVAPGDIDALTRDGNIECARTLAAMQMLHARAAGD